MIISVIVPLYNCGEYIADCLESLSMQGMSADEMEVIVVNDGSTDNGPQLVRDFRESHPEMEIKLITTENGGVCRARNTGLDNATGEYIYFLDADDLLLPGVLKFATDRMTGQNADVFHFGYEFRSIDYKVQNHAEIDFDAISVEKTNATLFWRYLINELKFCLSICRNIFRRSVIEKHGARFSPKINWAEEGDFMSKALCEECTALKTNSAFYIYRQRPGSCIYNQSEAHWDAAIRSRLEVIRLAKQSFDRLKEVFGEDSGIRFDDSFDYLVWIALRFAVRARISNRRMRQFLRELKGMGAYPIGKLPSGKDYNMSRFNKLTWSLLRREYGVMMLQWMLWWRKTPIMRDVNHNLTQD